jgi:peptidoglycan/xylan/chitin deacetylase (PgdA/CDA1 family)
VAYGALDSFETPVFSGCIKSGAEMTAKIPARGAILGYVTSIIMMTLGIVVLPVVTAPAATAATTCQTPPSGAIYRTPGPNQVALTIDDGPSGDWTPHVLNILQSHGVHATFFVIGENVRANPGMIGQILAGGNLVGNHTETHATLTGMSAAGQGQQMDSDLNRRVLESSTVEGKSPVGKKRKLQDLIQS